MCTRCRLATGRTNAVPGEGSPDTEVVFVGEGPGQNEDQQGRPFVGAAGGLLTELIGSIGWQRGEVFITNVVKCRPPGNRDPEPDEMAACAPFLQRQLEVLDPALVVTLGRYSMGTFFPGARIGQVHGQSRPADPATGARDAVAFAMYHPAAAFRQLSLKDTMRDDMAKVPSVLIEARRGRAERSQVEAAAIPMAMPQVEAAAIPEAMPQAEPDPMTADPDDPEPTVPIDAGADDLTEVLASIDMHAIPPERPPETDQMRLF